MSDIQVIEVTDEDVVTVSAEDDVKVMDAIGRITSRANAGFDADLADIRVIVSVCSEMTTRGFAELYEVSQTEASRWFRAAAITAKVVNAYKREPVRQRSITGLVAFASLQGTGNGETAVKPLVKARPSRFSAKVAVTVHGEIVAMLTKAGYSADEIGTILAAS